MNYSQNSLNLLTDVRAVARARAFASRHSIPMAEEENEAPISYIYSFLAESEYSCYDWDEIAEAKKLKKAFDKVLSRAYNSPINGCTNTHAVYFYK